MPNKHLTLTCNNCFKMGNSNDIIKKMSQKESKVCLYGFFIMCDWTNSISYSQLSLICLRKEKKNKACTARV